MCAGRKNGKAPAARELRWAARLAGSCAGSSAKLRLGKRNPHWLRAKLI